MKKKKKNAVCGYHYLRTLNIVHRDIKPLNMLIMIDETNRLSLKITDFGVSKMNAHQDEEMSTIIGSNRYMVCPLPSHTLLFGSSP